VHKLPYLFTYLLTVLGLISEVVNYLGQVDDVTSQRSSGIIVVSLRAYSEVSKTIGLSINSYGVLFMLEIINCMIATILRS